MWKRLIIICSMNFLIQSMDAELCRVAENVQGTASPPLQLRSAEEVVTVLRGTSCFNLTSEQIGHAKEKYRPLNGSTNFDTAIIKDETRWGEIFSKETVEWFNLPAEGPVWVPTKLLKRGARKVIVMGQGCNGKMGALMPFFQIFKDYDILIFNYRSSESASSKGDRLEQYLVDPLNDV